MSDATIRAELKRRMDAMGSGIGRVHDYERWAANDAAFIDLFQDPATKKIFGWEITRKAFRVKTIAMNKYQCGHDYVLRGYYGLQDSVASEKAFNVLVDLIVMDFATGKITGTQGHVLPKGSIGVRQFGRVLCHVAEIDLPDVKENITAEEAAELLTGIDIDYHLLPDDGARDAYDNIDLSEEEET